MTPTRQSETSTPGSARSLLLMGAVLFLIFVGERAFTKLMHGVRPGQLLIHLTPGALLWIFALLVFVPGFLLAERASTSRGRVVPYAILVLVGSALVAALTILLCRWLGFPAQAWAPADSPVAPEFSAVRPVLMRVGLAAFVYAAHRERLEAARAVQALETRQNEMMGRIASSRLEAARARVQPEAFIAELRALRRTNLQDPAAGGAGLEALISRLRAATARAAP